MPAAEFLRMELVKVKPKFYNILFILLSIIVLKRGPLR